MGTLLTCICYSLGLSYLLVSLASRAICLLSIHKNSLGAFLCLLSGFPDLITVVLLSRRPGMHQMAASNAFGSFAFNSCFSLGKPDPTPTPNLTPSLNLTPTPNSCFSLG